MQRESHEIQYGKSTSRKMSKYNKFIGGFKTYYKFKLTLMSYFGFFASLAIIFSNNL